uniref:Ubiquinol-cytochrome C reductase hinge domain-containing protein n=1 Tax=Arcella intermedia TaxID=1963864 RepID=A0A6B2LXN0_9EUKA
MCPVLEKTMEECKPSCVNYFDAYHQCVKRVGEEPPKGVNCELQYFDYYHCLDKCVPSRLFSKLK